MVIKACKPVVNRIKGKFPVFYTRKANSDNNGLGGKYNEKD